MTLSQLILFQISWTTPHFKGNYSIFFFFPAFPIPNLSQIIIIRKKVIQKKCIFHILENNIQFLNGWISVNFDPNELDYTAF